MKKENWIWMPHAGHFIGSNKCRFHLNTYVGDYIVSTVGEYWSGTFDDDYFKKFGFESFSVGDNHPYETMVFRAEKTDLKCCPYQQVSGDNLECVRYATAGEAMDGHMRLCEKWSYLKE